MDSLLYWFKKRIKIARLFLVIYQTLQDYYTILGLSCQVVNKKSHPNFGDLVTFFIMKRFNKNQTLN